MNCYLCEKMPQVGETIEFLKDLLPEDRQEFLFNKRNEAMAINEFMQNLKESKVYTLRLPCGKIIAMGGFVENVIKDEFYVWMLSATDSRKYPITIYKTVKNIIDNFKYSWLIALVYKKSKNHIKFIQKALNFKIISQKGQLHIYYKK